MSIIPLQLFAVWCLLRNAQNARTGTTIDVDSIAGKYLTTHSALPLFNVRWCNRIETVISLVQSFIKSRLLLYDLEKQRVVEKSFVRS